VGGFLLNWPAVPAAGLSPPILIHSYSFTDTIFEYLLYKLLTINIILIYNVYMVNTLNIDLGGSQMAITALIGTRTGVDVHKAGCKDLDKAKNSFNNGKNVYESVAKMFEELLDTGDETNPGWIEAEFKFFPCVKTSDIPAPATVQNKSPMESVNETSKLWVGAKVIGFSGNTDRMDLQIELTNGTHMRINGPVKRDPNFN
jgi:hypothetical protein